ncbi:coiled-coil domain-containing protein 149 [Pararge aegeria]|uniref:Jg16292 protein n=3 Tax=Pararge aegeria TaxID=116150 RepID=A0A8S4RX81_9NEOP|nr:coiled-coil domain-containing protein 149 [Pararge aegeria]CAH2241723.1 jg16292 [Pararge aegeria aegeria]
MFTKPNKVQFQDQQLDDYVLENSVLKSKLQSKIDALSIMSKELDKCSMERDRFKILVEQLKCKKVLQENTNSWDRFAPTNTISGSEILAKTKEHNNMLKLEVEMLRSNLEEANGDIIALRNQFKKEQNYEEFNGNKRLCLTSRNDYEQLVQELEKVKKKYQQIQLDYRATLDDKEELVSDRDYYKNKVQRLNQQISYILNNRTKSQAENDTPKPIVDIDAILTENKYLHERITQLQVEKEIVKRTLTKYKFLLDNKSKNETWNLKKGYADVMTQKQVREYLEINSKTGLKRNSAAELKSLCLGLFEALNDKSIALQHQRRTNQILANRITELEKTLESWCNGEKCIPSFPSQMLIEELLDAGSVKSAECREKSEREPLENLTNKITSDSEDEISKGNDDSSVDLNHENGSGDSRSLKKIVLPQELEELVKEALAEIKSVQ